MHVWVQTSPGHFDTDATLRLELPVKLDTTRQLDVSFSSHALQLDEDGRGDCVVFAGDKRSDKVRTQVLVYGRQADARGRTPLFGPEGLPRQLIVIGGFAGYPDFDDVDCACAYERTFRVVLERGARESVWTVWCLRIFAR